MTRKRRRFTAELKARGAVAAMGGANPRSSDSRSECSHIRGHPRVSLPKAAPHDQLASNRPVGVRHTEGRFRFRLSIAAPKVRDIPAQANGLGSGLARTQPCKGVT